MNTNPSVELSLPSRLGYEKVAMNTAASVARLMGFSDDRIEDLKTALAEACINAIEHGNRLNSNLQINVEMFVHEEEGELEVKVVDEGSGPLIRPDKPDIDRKMHGEEDSRGMGIFLIQALVDEAEWVPLSSSNKSYVRLMIRMNREGKKVQQETQASVDTTKTADGSTVTVLRYQGDISSASNDAILGTHSRLPVDSARRLLLDFTKVDYINSSGIALIIQLLMQANRVGQNVAVFGLTPHFQKVFKMVGIPKYAEIFADEAAALA